MLWKENFESLFGAKPSVPNLEKLSLGDEQNKAISDNIAAAPEASKLANLTMDQIMSMLGKVDPNFQSKANKISGNIDDLLAGKVPGSRSEASIRYAAGRNLELGTSGSPAGDNLVLRDLGLDQLNATSLGLSQAESWLSSVERLLSPAMATYTGMFVTPMQEYSTHNEQNLQQFQKQWMSNQIQALPDPVIRGVQDTVMQLSGRGGQPQSGQQYSTLSTPGKTDPVNMNNDWSSGWSTAETSSGFDNPYGYGAPDPGTGAGFDPATIDVSGFV